ncbi:WD40 repeat protein [Kordia periserrulae]|uniref:WD40 repeat protein n=1 Tax=Kordia periserrulae TaxID=701523 RepID=A0A2T6BZH8_9FLAO|nr:PD40 domain-containing protein [Kordia periserrulae]PTX61456.1 WD40 repeat protein [Kordia periserrulae]
MKHIAKLFVGITFVGMISCSNSPKVRYVSETISAPAIFAEGIISTAHNEFNLDFTPDGKTIYFTRRVEGKPQKIFVSHFKENYWTTPTVADFSLSRDEMPAITPDGKHVYFASTRPIPNRESEGDFDMNIWVTNLEKDSWKTTKPLDSIINKVQIDGEKWPSSNESSLYTQDGKTFYFSTMMRNTDAIGIYTTTLEKQQFTTPKRITGLFDKDSYWTSSPTLSPDGNYLLFNAYDVEGGFGGEDIYVSQKTANGWSKALNLGGLINSKNEDAFPKFSRDGQYFFFVSNRKYKEKEDIWNIYSIESNYLQLKSLFN